MLEKDVERYLKKEVEKMNGYAYKFISPGNSGVPDRIVLLPIGRIVFVELKRPGGKTTLLQDKQIEKIRSKGFVVRVMHSKDEVDDFIEEVKNGI